MAQEDNFPSRFVDRHVVTVCCGQECDVSASPPGVQALTEKNKWKAYSISTPSRLHHSHLSLSSTPLDVFTKKIWKCTKNRKLVYRECVMIVRIHESSTTSQLFLFLNITTVLSSAIVVACTQSSSRVCRSLTNSEQHKMEAEVSLLSASFACAFTDECEATTVA